MKGSKVYIVLVTTYDFTFIKQAFADREAAIRCALEVYESWHRDVVKIDDNGRDYSLQADEDNYIEVCQEILQ